MVRDRKIILAARLRVPGHVIHRSLDSETVVLNLETGAYHGLNPTGGRMLEVLSEAPTVRAAAEIIATEYEQDLEIVADDLASLCVELLDCGLVEIVEK